MRLPSKRTAAGSAEPNKAFGMLPHLFLASLVLTAAASAQRLGKPGSGTAGLGSSAGQRPFPQDMLALPAFQLDLDGPPIRNASALELLQTQPSHDGATDVANHRDSELVKASAHPPHARASNVTWELYRTSPSSIYLCGVPRRHPPHRTTPQLSRRELVQERRRVLRNGLALLAPLKSTCLFHTLDWFTYSFCHGDQVRQFHALPGTTLPGRTPGVDPSQDSFVLGRWSDDIEGGAVDDSTAQPSGGRVDSDKTKQHGMAGTGLERGILNDHASEGADHAANDDDSSTEDDDDDGRIGSSELMEVISFSSDGYSDEGDQHAERYISQLWTGGTTCDINDEPRTVEVQYHCSTRRGDRITLIKETTTCSYVLVIETSRLCQEPAFVPREEAQQTIQCGRIVGDDWVEPEPTAPPPHGLLPDQDGAMPRASQQGIGNAGPSSPTGADFGSDSSDSGEGDTGGLGAGRRRGEAFGHAAPTQAANRPVHAERGDDAGDDGHPGHGAEGESDDFHTHGDWSSYGYGAGTGDGADATSILYEVGFDEDGNLVVESMPADETVGEGAVEDGFEEAMYHDGGAEMGAGEVYYDDDGLGYADESGWDAYDDDIVDGGGRQADRPMEVRVDMQDLLDDAGVDAHVGGGGGRDPPDAAAAAERLERLQGVLSKAIEQQLRRVLEAAKARGGDGGETHDAGQKNPLLQRQGGQGQEAGTTGDAAPAGERAAKVKRALEEALGELRRRQADAPPAAAAAAGSNGRGGTRQPGGGGAGEVLPAQSERSARLFAELNGRAREGDQGPQPGKGGREVPTGPGQGEAQGHGAYGTKADTEGKRRYGEQIRRERGQAVHDARGRAATEGEDGEQARRRRRERDDARGQVPRDEARQPGVLHLEL